MAQNTTICIAYKIEGVNGGFQKLTVEADAFRKLMEANLTEVEKLKKSFMDFTVISTGIMNIQSSANALLDSLSAITGESMDFDKAMKAANTMAGKDSDGFRKMKEEVAELAKQLPIARDELANGLYQVISNGVPEGNWLEYLRTSARSAVGGIADINKVVGVTSTVIKNYGMEWSAAADIQDKIQLTAKNGVTSFEQLAQALPRVTGNAATLGVTIDELLGTFATLTGVSGNTAEVSTQLAAIFSALVKPSSEATKMAAQMGIQFDAAAIKAAGGFQNFLHQLDESVKAYSQASGVLEQEVYGKLFGSAESLRALVPLQGELAEKFTANVAEMVNSAGTMDAAFKDMSSTGEATTQMLKNKMSAIVDVAAGFTSAALPYLTFSAALLTTASNTMILVGAFKKLRDVQLLVAARSALLHARTMAVNTVIKATALFSKKTALGLEMLRVASKGSERAIFGLQIAIRGLLLATGVGAAIWGLTWIIQQLTDTSGDAANGLKKLDDASEEYTEAAASAKVQIDKEIKSLEELIKTRKSSKEAIDHLNETYGELFGKHETEKEWYDTLIGKSKAYIKQLGYEAQAQALKARLSEIYVKKEQAEEKKAELEKSGKHRQTVTYQAMGSQLTHTSETKEYREVSKELEDLTSTEAELEKRLDAINQKAEANSKELNSGKPGPQKELKVEDMSWQQAKDALDKAETDLKNADPKDTKKVKELQTHYNKVKARKEALDKKYGFGNAGRSSSEKKTEVADPKSSEELSTNIEIYRKKLTGEDTEEQRVYREKIARWEKAKEAIEMMRKETERPSSLSTFEDIDKEISYQRTIRQKASKENIAEIDSEIKRLEELGEELELAGHVPVPVEEIKTYGQLNSELSYFNSLLERADDTQRASIQEQINQLNELKKTWDRQLEELKEPGDIGTLDTIGKLDEAISYYQARQKDASEDEIQEIQKTIDAYERKRTAMQRGIEIPSMLREADEINRLTGKEYKLKIRGMGFDELTEKIRELQRMLNDMDHPVTDSQRKDIEGLIATYEKWRKEGIDSFDTFREGWGNLKGISGAVESLTDTLNGDANAWQKLTAIVDGFIQIFEGVKAIVGIIDMLTLATQQHTVAKETETAATATQTAETIAQTSATVADTSATLANTAAKSGEAVANATSSGAKMPFPLNIVAIAAGVAAVIGALAVVGKFADGGIVGGNSPSGDRLLARVNTGEMILNKKQQGNLFDFINKAGGNALALGIPRFAEGGIVSGPTLGLVGEYAGAKSNPEVIAPLDRLRDLIGNDENGANGRVEFEIRGDRLYGLLRKYERNKNRT